MNGDNTWNAVNPESSLETQCPRFLLGSGHAGTLCLVHNRILDSQKGNKCLAYTTLFVQFKHWVTHHLRNPSPQTPANSQLCKQDLSKDSSFRSAMLTLFGTGMISATYSITITTITIWKEEKIRQMCQNNDWWIWLGALWEFFVVFLQLLSLKLFQNKK